DLVAPDDASGPLHGKGALGDATGAGRLDDVALDGDEMSARPGLGGSDAAVVACLDIHADSDRARQSHGAAEDADVVVPDGEAIDCPGCDDAFLVSRSMHLDEKVLDRHVPHVPDPDRTAC